jgi:hypothetical protein
MSFLPCKSVAVQKPLLGEMSLDSTSIDLCLTGPGVSTRNEEIQIEPRKEFAVQLRRLTTTLTTARVRLQPFVSLHVA